MDSQGEIPLNPPSLRGLSEGPPRASAERASSQARYLNVRTLSENLDRVLMLGLELIGEGGEKDVGFL